MKGKRRSEQELEPERKCRHSSSVKQFFTRRLPILLLLALCMGAVCGLIKLDEVSTTWTAFVVGFLTIALLRRGSEQMEREAVNYRFVEGGTRKGMIPVVDSKLDGYCLEWLNDLDGRIQSPVWISAETRAGWEQKAQAYAMQLGGIAAEAREVAARLNAAARQAHAYAGNIVSLGVPETNDDSSIRIVGTGDSAFSDGMSTRSNALFEDFGLNTEDPLSCNTVLTAEAISVVPKCGVMVTSEEAGNTVQETAHKLRAIGGQTSEEVAVVTGGGTAVATNPSMESRPTKSENRNVESGKTPRQSSELSTLGAGARVSIVETRKALPSCTKNLEQRSVEGAADVRTQHEVSEVVTAPDSLPRTIVHSEDGWSAGNTVSSDMFEPIPSEEASLRTGQLQNTSLTSGLHENEASLSQITASRGQGLHKRSVNLEDWAETEFASTSGHEDESSPVTGDGTANHLSGVKSGMSYKSACTDISLLAGDARTGPEGDLARRTASFRDTGTERHAASTEYAITSMHRVSKSDGDFLFRNSTDGSASERENALTGSPTGYSSARVRDMTPRNGQSAAEMTGRRTNRSQGIASRLRGALTSKRFSTSKVVPRRDDTQKPSMGSRKNAGSKSVAPKREDVFKVNRIPSTEAASNVENDPGIPVRRRLLALGSH